MLNVKVSMLEQESHTQRTREQIKILTIFAAHTPFVL